MIYDNTISYNGGWGILCEFGSPSNAGVNGTQLISDNPNLGNNGLGMLAQYWMLQVRVNWSANGTGVPQRFVWINDTGGNPVWQGYTDNDGYTDEIEVLQYYFPNGSTAPTILIPYQIQANSSQELCYVTDNTLYIYYL